MQCMLHCSMTLPGREVVLFELSDYTTDDEIPRFELGAVDLKY